MIAVTGREMQQMDRLTIEEIGVPAGKLMENAGRRVFEEIEKFLGPVGGKRVGIISGKGNNGGDGLVTARLLHQKGARVEVFLLADPVSLKGDALSNLERFKKLGGSLQPLLRMEDALKLKASLRECDLILDALFGTGLSSELKDLPKEAVDAINQSGKPVVSVDIPSGIHADTGKLMGSAVRADLTVTFAFPKKGHLLNAGIDHTGRLKIVDIGIPPELGNKVPSDLIYWTAEDARALIKPRKASTHKGKQGHTLVIAGSAGKGGAAVMSGLSALRTGAGLVTLAWPAGLEKTVSNRPLEIMTLPLSETADGSLGMAALDPLLKFAQDKTAVALGPGLSTNPETQELVRELVKHLRIPVIIDADGLNALVGRLDLIDRSPAPLILTPHPGELARLLETSSKEIQEDRLGSVSRAMDLHPAVWVLKGARTLVGAPGGPFTVNSTGNPGMATAGTGDVLTGVIAGFLSQGYSILESSRLGVFLHGLAGDLAARDVGSVGLIAGDLIKRIPPAFTRILQT